MEQVITTGILKLGIEEFSLNITLLGLTQESFELTVI
jgi:hypothetical protein